MCAADAVETENYCWRCLITVRAVAFKYKGLVSVKTIVLCAASVERAPASVIPRNSKVNLNNKI